MAVVGEQQLDRRVGHCELQTATDRVERRRLVVGHLERARELGLEVATARVGLHEHAPARPTRARCPCRAAASRRTARRAADRRSRPSPSADRTGHDEDGAVVDDRRRDRTRRRAAHEQERRERAEETPDPTTHRHPGRDQVVLGHCLLRVFDHVLVPLPSPRDPTGPSGQLVSASIDPTLTDRPADTLLPCDSCRIPGHLRDFRQRSTRPRSTTSPGGRSRCSSSSVCCASSGSCSSTPSPCTRTGGECSTKSRTKDDRWRSRRRRTRRNDS